jgi:hypothetical protein
MNPFEPRALVDPISDKAKKISCSEGIVQKESFSSIDIQLSKREKSSSSNIGIEELKTFLK